MSGTNDNAEVDLLDHATLARREREREEWLARLAAVDGFFGLYDSSDARRQ